MEGGAGPLPIIRIIALLTFPISRLICFILLRVKTKNKKAFSARAPKDIINLIDEGIDHKFYDHDQGLQIKYKSRLYVEFDALIYKEAFHEKGDDCFAKKYGVCTIAACLKAKSTSKPLIALHINSDGEDHFALVQPGSVTNNGYKNNDDEPMHIEQLWREHVTNNGTTARPKKQRPASDDSELPSKSTRSRTREDSDSEDDRARKRHKSDNNLSNQVSPQLTELLADVASIGQNISALSATISSQHDKTSRQLVLLNNTTNAKHTAIEERLKSLSDEIKAVNSSIKTLDEVVQRILSHVKADAKEKEKVVVVQAPIPQMRQEPHYVVPPNYYSGTPSYNGPYNSPSSRFF